MLQPFIYRSLQVSSAVIQTASWQTLVDSVEYNLQKDALCHSERGQESYIEVVYPSPRRRRIFSPQIHLGVSMVQTGKMGYRINR